MAPPAKAPTRKRNRKRKRRASFSSSSSSLSGSSSSSSEDNHKPSQSLAAKKPAEPSVSSSSSSESDSDTSSDSSTSKPLAAQQSFISDQTQSASKRRSPSPPPPATTIPSFIPSAGSVEGDARKEQILKDRFRKFWMASVADGFKDDLEEIRKEPLGPSRLSMLIDSLASGADVFTSSSRPGDSESVNEMEVVLEINKGDPS